MEKGGVKAVAFQVVGVGGSGLVVFVLFEDGSVTQIEGNEHKVIAGGRK